MGLNILRQRKYYKHLIIFETERDINFMCAHKCLLDKYVKTNGWIFSNFYARIVTKGLVQLMAVPHKHFKYNLFEELLIKITSEAASGRNGKLYN